MVEVIHQLSWPSFKSLPWHSPHAVIQELGREGILPFSSIFASNRPFNAPLAGLFAEYFVSCIYLIVVPPGDAYNFLINSKINTSNPHSMADASRHQCRLLRRMLSIPWFRLACSSCICRRIEFGIGILLFELQRLSFPYFYCPTFFWWLCRSFHRLQGQGYMRNFPTGYVICQSSLILFIHSSFFFEKKSHTRLVPWRCHCLELCIGIYGVSGFRKGKDIVSSESGLFRKTVSLDTHTAKYLGLCYSLLRRTCQWTWCVTSILLQYLSQVINVVNSSQ